MMTEANSVVVGPVILTGPTRNKKPIFFMYNLDRLQKDYILPAILKFKTIFYSTYGRNPCLI